MPWSSKRPWMPVLAVLALVALALNVLGALSIARIPDFGYNRVGDTVQQVVAGGAADLAGFRDGDILRRIERIDVADPAALGALPPAAIGTPRVYQLERDGTRFDTTLVPAGLPAGQILATRINAVIGILFLVVGLWAYGRLGDSLGAVVATLGIAVAPAMTNPPLRLLASSWAPTLLIFWAAFGLLASACFFHFALLFAGGGEGTVKPRTALMIYGPVALWTLLAVFGLRLPAFWLELAYILPAFTLLIVRYRRALKPAPRRALGRFLWLTVAALVPYVVIGASSTAGVVTQPLISQMGSWSLALVPVALAWSLAGLKPARAAAGSRSSSPPSRNRLSRETGAAPPAAGLPRPGR